MFTGTKHLYVTICPSLTQGVTILVKCMLDTVDSFLNLMDVLRGEAPLCRWLPFTYSVTQTNRDHLFECGGIHGHDIDTAIIPCIYYIENPHVHANQFYISIS